ncbi:MAG: hypothetical protein ACLUQC_03945 [Lactococcus raffinolactis]|jgi:hypothetical protein|uniref:hypothetical protein n=1 Tax=Pseudolactococcus raffinolactis TaxID=1366 RepID=UPI003994FD72
MENNSPELIVMLTHNDRTVANAHDIFEQCQNSKAKFWGFKGSGLPIDKMKQLFAQMKKQGKERKRRKKSMQRVTIFNFF